jgi:hypothetical protein
MPPSQPVERDPVVAHVLRSISVPDHRPGFWTELEARLAEVDARRVGQQSDPATSPTASAAVPHRADGSELPVVEPRQTEGWRDRRVRQRRLLLRVAALVLLTGAATVLILSRDDHSLEPGSVPETTTAGTPAPTSTPTPAGETPETAVQEFVRTIGSDDDAAFAMLTRESREFLGSSAQLAAGFGPDLSLWSSPGAIEQETTMVPRTPADPPIEVVTLTGTLDVHGAPQPRTQAFALRLEDDAWRISLTATAVSASAGPAIEMIIPAVDPALECCGIGGVVADGDPIEFRLAVAAGIRHVNVAFDGGEPLSPAQLELSDAVVTARPQLAAGTHVVTIAIVLPDGVCYARAVQFVVE